MLWVLVLAVPVYGSAGALLQMLGPVHRHAVPAALPTQTAKLHPAPRATPTAKGFVPAWVVKPWQAWKEFAHAQSHGGLLQHAHAHDDFERHHHDPGDDAVTALGADDARSTAAELGAAAAAGNASLPMGTATPWLVPPCVADAPLWSLATVARWRDADQRRRDRPPTTLRRA